MKRILSMAGTILGLTLLALLAFGGPGTSGRTPPEAQNGVLDLRQWDFRRDGAVALRGDWAFAWGEHRPPAADLSSAPQRAEAFLSVPGIWNGKQENGASLPGDGFATYRLTVLMRPPKEPLAVKLLDMATAFRLYANGTRVASAGLAGHGPATTIPEYAPTIAPIAVDSDRLEILVHVSNFHHWQGGMWETILLGPESALSASRERALLFNFLLLGGILIMGLYHVGIAWLRKEDAASLYFGIFCLLMGVRLLATGERYLLHLVPGLDYELLMKTVYLSFYGCVPVFAAYMKSLFPRHLSRRVVFAANVSGLLLAVLVMAAPARVYTITMPTFQFFTLGLLLYGVGAVIHAAVRRQNGALVFLAGFSALCAAAANDILYTRQLVDTGHFFQVGFFLFLFSQAFLLSRRFAGAFATVERQRRDLADANTAYKRELEQRKRTDAKIAESEKKYRELFESSSELLCIHDLEGNLLETNLHFKEEYGWSREDLEGLNIREMMPKKYLAKFDRYMERLLAAGADEGLLTGATKSGAKVLMEYRNRLIRDSSGAPVAVQGTARDVTRSYQAEKARRESEEKYKEIVQYAPAGIYEFDMETLRFTSVNDVMCQYTGYTESEFLAMDPFAILAEESKETLIRLIEEVTVHQRRELAAEYRIRGKSGREFWVLSNARFFYENEIPKRAMAVVHDMTEIRRAEAARRDLETKLQNAKKLESLGTLAGGVAHDLNNILSGILSYPDLLLHDLDADSHLRAPLMAIRRSGEKAAEIVQDLLTLARRGGQNRKALDLNQLVSNFLESPEFHKIASAREALWVETELADDVLAILGSEVHLAKTVMNLVANAADAMPAGGTVTLSTESCYLDRAYDGFETVPEGEYTVLRVRDTGIGMSRADLEHIFEPFYTKKTMGHSGTGLGMSVVWGTVKDHDGFVDIVTEEGFGTTFTFYFPVSRREAEPKAAVHIEDYLGQGESILVIDDSEEQRGLASRMLQRLGYAVEAVDSGEAAVAIIQDGRVFDLLVLDMIMAPGMDGLATYREILRMAPGQRAIIASGFAENEAVRETQRLGAGAYVKKPYSLEAIGLAVRAEFDRRE